MITESEIYWMTRLDYLRGLCIAGIVVPFLVLLVVVWAAEDVSEAFKWAARAFVVWLCISVLSGLGLVFVPTTGEYAMIKVVPAIANSKVVAEELPADMRQIYDLGKKALIEKLKGEKAK